MTKHLENKLTMLKAVETLMVSNAGRTAGIPALTASVQRLTTCVNAIKAKANDFDAAATGKTRIKEAAQESLIDTLRTVSGALCAYASLNHMPDLKEKVDMPGREIRRMRDMDLVNRATAVAALARQNLGALRDYTVTEAVLAELKKKTDAFEQSVGIRETGVTDRSAARKALVELFDEADRIVEEEMDKLMQAIRTSQSEFYNSYRSARLIRELGTRSAKEPAVAAPVAVTAK